MFRGSVGACMACPGQGCMGGIMPPARQCHRPSAHPQNPHTHTPLQVERLVSALEAGLSPDAEPTVSGRLGGRWELEWTTEGSVHGIVRALPVSGISQTVELG
jgi:hypothetical protein